MATGHPVAARPLYGLGFVRFRRAEARRVRRAVRFGADLAVAWLPPRGYNAGLGAVHGLTISAYTI